MKKDKKSEQFLNELSKKSKKFNVIAEYYGKGLFSNEYMPGNLCKKEKYVEPKMKEEMKTDKNKSLKFGSDFNISNSNLLKK